MHEVERRIPLEHSDKLHRKRKGRGKRGKQEIYQMVGRRRKDIPSLC